MFGLDPITFMASITVIVLIAIMGSLIASCYKTCGPNEAMIVTGMNAGQGFQSFKIIVGGGTIVLPLIQQRHIISLEQLRVEVPMVSPMVTVDKQSITMDCVGQIKVKGDDISIAAAAEQLLGKESTEIVQIAQDIIGGHVRAVLATMTLDELVQNLRSVSQKIQEICICDFAKMGLTVVTLTMKDIRNTEGRLYPFQHQNAALETTER